MADSLFDNRYRYDYIYPRGRSGETLRAVDTQAADRPVVIKRPAPNDAPPIRAGQEVSILNERKALTRLAGHAVLTALLGSGQFLVGGTPHQYIVIERAEGLIIADTVLELAARGERLPHLEMLVILDHLLDLLHTAHTRDIVYNDVDAKHLFWDRDRYQLKVIDWGNAVFLEGDETTPQGINRQSDIFQVGELLYFILSGGGRPDIPRDAGDDFRVDFGDSGPQVHSRLQTIVTRALHPSPRLRYQQINDLRRDLADYRGPLERERDSIVGRVTERLRRNLSKNDLHGLLGLLEPALKNDPGFPAARQSYEEIVDRLRDLEVSADLDAVRIYMESSNWPRAADLLKELREKAGAQTGKLINLLLDCTILLIDTNLQPVPVPVLDALILLFEGHPGHAAQVLLTQEDNASDTARSLQWLLAERISAHIPDVLLLRPNLYRLELALSALSAEGLVVTEPRALLLEINTNINSTPASGGANLAELRDRYRQLVDQLTALSAMLEPLSAAHSLSNRKLPLSALQRALDAAMALADNMHVIGRQAATSPRDAIAALDSSRAVDPTNPLWQMVSKLLNNLYELLQSYQTFVPAADGSDLDLWLKDAQRDLEPFVGRLFDEMLSAIVQGVDTAAEAWEEYSATVVQGNRIGAINALSAMIDAVTTISPTLAGWLNQLRNVITGANYIERHAVYGGLGRALADGWESFDRGRLSDAERLGQQAYEIARSDRDRFAAARLRDLAQITRDWVERSAVNNLKRTEAALENVERLYTEEENTLRDNFAAQMPSKETYLRAMNKGLVEIYARTSTAANRILFINYLLLGTLDTHETKLDDTAFWREAAVRTLGDFSTRHAATRALDEFIERRRHLNAAADLLNTVNSPRALPTLENTRRQIEENPQARTLAAAVYSLREFEAALRDWSDGEFRPAGLKLENALNAINEVEQTAEITLTAYRAWLMDLQGHAAELHNLSRLMRQVIERRPEKPDHLVREAHQRMVEVTQQALGSTHAAALKVWHDTYEDFLAVYTDPNLRRSARLNRFSDLFRAMFIDRHPAYPLYRHWYTLTENAPEFPAPPTDEPLPRIESEHVQESEYRGARYGSDQPRAKQVFRLPRWVLLASTGAAVLAAVLLLSGVLNPPDASTIAGIQLTITDTPTPDLTATLNTSQSQTPASPQVPSDTPAPTTDPRLVTPTLLPGAAFNTPTLPPTRLTDTPTFTPTHTSTATPTETFTPTHTVTPSNTPTPTATFTPSNTPTATLPPQGLQGPQDVLDLLRRVSLLPWPTEHFSLVNTLEGASWRLGMGARAPGDSAEIIVIALPADLLETYYGNNAASRLRRLEVTLALTTFNPSLLAENQVYFGALLQDTNTSATSAGLQINLVQPTVINISRLKDGTAEFISQRSVNALVLRLKLERDPASGAVALFLNDNPIDTLNFLPADAPVLPVLFVRNGGVIISVSNWKITLR